MPRTAITLTFGGYSRDALLMRLRASRVEMNDFGRALMERPEFENPPRSDVDVVILSAGSLRPGLSFDEVVDAAAGIGLAPLPLTVGPWLRLAMLDQPDAPDSVLSAGRAPSGSIHVISPPPSLDDAYPKGFYLRTVDGVPWLRGFRCDATYVWPPDSLLAFARPRTSE